MARLAWALWALAIIDLWFDHLVRQAGRPTLARRFRCLPTCWRNWVRPRWGVAPVVAALAEMFGSQPLFPSPVPQVQSPLTVPALAAAGSLVVRHRPLPAV